MATGSLDANGIWLYGEDDSEPTHSALLNKLGTSVSDTVTRLESFTGYTGVLPIANGGTNANNLNSAQNNLRQGLVNMIPSSVTPNAGGSATVSALGQVAFSGSSGVAVNNVFTSDYLNYCIVYSATGNTNVNLGLRMRYGSTNNGNSTYYYAGKGRQAGGVDINIEQNPGTYYIPANLVGTGNVVHGVIDIISPFPSSKTGISSRSATFLNQPGVVTVGGYDDQVAANDGIYLFAVSGNLAITFTVYGYND